MHRDGVCICHRSTGAMPDWVETMLAFIGAGAAGGLAKPVFDFFSNRGRQHAKLQAAEITDLAQWRQELVNRVSEQEGRVETLRGQIDEWQEKYREVTTQNSLLQQQVESLKEQNEDLKRMVAALEDENEALQKKLNEMDS